MPLTNRAFLGILRVGLCGAASGWGLEIRTFIIASAYTEGASMFGAEKRGQAKEMSREGESYGAKEKGREN